MRVLIATVTVGGGHVQAAAALEEAWRKVRPKDTLQRVDVLDLAPPLYKKVYNDAYLKLVEHAPEVYAMLFKRTDNPEFTQKLNKLRRPLAHRMNWGFVRHLTKFNADIVLCSHYLPLEIFSELQLKKPDLKQPFIACVVTDFEAHALWMETSVDLYCVAAEHTEARLIARGVPGEKVAVTGIPISGRFSEPIDVAAVRRRTGLRDDLPVLLVLGGGFGLGPVIEILDVLEKVRKPLQVIVVAGKNPALRAQAAARDYRNPTRVLGFVTNMHEWMALADLILTKPGGLTSSEALAMGKPLLIFNPIPGQEEANSDFLLEHGAAIKVNALEDLPFRLEKLLGSKKLIDLAARSRQLGRPRAALDIIHAVLAAYPRKPVSAVARSRNATGRANRGRG